MVRAKKEILRRCTGCGAMKDRMELIRVIRDRDGAVHVDETQKQNGRGAYLCRSLSCFETALKRRSLERTLKCSVSRSVYDQIKKMIEAGQ